MAVAYQFTLSKKARAQLAEIVGALLMHISSKVGNILTENDKQTLDAAHILAGFIHEGMPPVLNNPDAFVNLLAFSVNAVDGDELTWGFMARKLAEIFEVKLQPLV